MDANEEIFSALIKMTANEETSPALVKMNGGDGTTSTFIEMDADNETTAAIVKMDANQEATSAIIEQAANEKTSSATLKMDADEEVTSALIDLYSDEETSPVLAKMDESKETNSAVVSISYGEPTTNKSPFLGIASELRCLFYAIIFENVKITIEVEAFAETRRYLASSPDWDFLSITQTSKLIREESLPILYTHLCCKYMAHQPWLIPMDRLGTGFDYSQIQKLYFGQGWRYEGALRALITSFPSLKELYLELPNKFIERPREEGPICYDCVWVNNTIPCCEKARTIDYLFDIPEVKFEISHLFDPEDGDIGNYLMFPSHVDEKAELADEGKLPAKIYYNKSILITPDDIRDRPRSPLFHHAMFQVRQGRRDGMDKITAEFDFDTGAAKFKLNNEVRHMTVQQCGYGSVGLGPAQTMEPGDIGWNLVKEDYWKRHEARVAAKKKKIRDMVRFEWNYWN